MKGKPKLFKAKDWINSKPTEFEMNGETYIYVGTNILSNEVTLKNTKTGEYSKWNYYKLKDEIKRLSTRNSNQN